MENRGLLMLLILLLVNPADMYTVKILPYTKQGNAFWLYSVSQKKSPPRVFWKFFPNGWEFLINFLHTYYAIICTLEY